MANVAQRDQERKWLYESLDRAPAEAARSTDQWPRELRTAFEAAVDAWWTENDPEGDEFDCTDNYRYARQSDSVEVGSYDRLSAQGCCGCVDVLLTVLGEEILYGFNYGH